MIHFVVRHHDRFLPASLRARTGRAGGTAEYLRSLAVPILP
jgi:hypothetical protein